MPGDTDAIYPCQARQLPSDAHITLPHIHNEHGHRLEAHVQSSATDRDNDGSAVIPESHDAYNTPRSPPNSNRARPPPLSSSKSAPPTKMEAMVQQSSSQQAFNAMTRAESFHGYPGGDTQPMESQVYRDYTESMAVKRSRIYAAATPTSRQIPEKTVLYVSPDGKVNTYGTGTVGTDKTPHTIGEGETGFIDLANAWERERSQGAKSTTSDFDDLLRSPETQPHVGDEGRSQQRTIPPETPTVAGHKRSRSGEILTSATTKGKQTPAYSQLFAGFNFGQQKDPPMGATQLFGQTQALSTPMPDGELRSDPALTRPSPDLRHTQVGLSSPVAATTSSPVATLNGRLPSSTAAEPRDNYTSMRESQERRAARLRRELHAAHGLSMLEESDEDEYDWSQERKNVQRRLQRARSDQDLSTWSKIRAPSRPASGPGSGRRHPPATVDLVTPAPGRFRRGEKVEFEISDDEDTDVEEQPMPEGREGEGGDQDLPVAEDDHRDGAAVGGQNDEGDDVYDELGQTVLRSQLDDRGQDEGPEDEDEEMEDGEDQAPDDSDRDIDGEGHGSRHHSPQEPHDPEAATITENIATLTQPSAIADSQPQQERDKRHALRRDSAPVEDLHQNHHSSMTSFVPGSQYAGRTSQDLATLKPSSLTRLSASQPQPGEKLPSSPPLPQASLPHASFPQLSGETLPPGSAEASIARRGMLAQFQQRSRRSDRRRAAHTHHEIPESEPNLSDAAPQEPSALPTTDIDTASHLVPESNSLAIVPFSTARTHQSSPSKSQTRAPAIPSALAATQASRSSVESPRKAAGVRRFADIAAEPSQSAEGVASQAEVDIDGLMQEVMTEGDKEFIEAVSSPVSEPVRKRRRVREKTTGVFAELQEGEDVETEEPETSISKAAKLLRQKAHAPAELVVSDSTLESGHVLRSSPSKANELLVSTPEKAPPRKGTQDSVKKREAAGAAAVSQLLSTRNGKRVRLTNLAATGRKAAVAAPASSGGEQTKNPGGGVATREKRGRKDVAKAEKARRAKSIEHAEPSVADEGSAEIAEPAPTTEPTAPVAPTSKTPNRTTTTGEPDAPLSITAPNRIFALFKGHFNAFYPATHLSTSPDGQTHKVRFEDHNVTTLEAHLVRSLALRVGDQIKVDGKGWRKDVWIIKGFVPAANADEERGVEGRDVYGRTVVKVQARASRRSSLEDAERDAAEGPVFEVLVSDVYLTMTLWHRFEDRPFVPESRVAGTRGGSRLATPSAGLRTPDAETPSTRSRRGIGGVGGGSTASKRLSHLRAEDFTDEAASKPLGLFSGMAFAISYTTDSTEKATITRQIQRHGGLILDTGFDELFDLRDLEHQDIANHPAACSAPATNPDPASLRLKPPFTTLSFVALLADKHSRRAKYMQALALGLPALSPRWLTDSLAANDPLPWPKYLLAAGESTHLSHSAIRSRYLPLAYTNPSPTSIKLRDTIAARPKLLHGEGVLIVAPFSLSSGTGGAGKAARGDGWVKRKVYAFLTLALGAGAVRRIGDVAEARRILSAEEGWSWVYVAGGVWEAGRAILGAEVGRAARGKGEMVVRGSGGVGVVNDEFVVQSLILGDLVG